MIVLQAIEDIGLNRQYRLFPVYSRIIIPCALWGLPCNTLPCFCFLRLFFRGFGLAVVIAVLKDNKRVLIHPVIVITIFN